MAVGQKDERRRMRLKHDQSTFFDQKNADGRIWGYGMYNERQQDEQGMMSRQDKTTQGGGEET
jgi:hypothetical protein